MDEQDTTDEEFNTVYRMDGEDNDDDDDDDRGNACTPSELSLLLQKHEQEHQKPKSRLVVSEHSYLPGAAHPLHTIGTLVDTVVNENCELADLASSSTTTTTTTPTRISNLTKIAVLELNDIVLFPGSTLPVRITDRNWIQYLGRQIDELRCLSSTARTYEAREVRIGILCRSSSNRQIFRFSSPSSSSSSSPLISSWSFLQPGTLSRSSSRSSSSTISENEGDTAMQRRQSWTRQGYGPVRLRRFSDRLIEELGQDFSLEDNNYDSPNNSPNNNRGSDQRNDNLHHEHPSAAGNVLGETQNTATAHIYHNNHNQNPDPTDTLPLDDHIHVSSSSPLPLQSHTSTRTDSRRRQENLHRLRRRQQQRQQLQQNQDQDTSRFVGRVGTIATIVLTHGDSLDEQHQLPHQPRYLRQPHQPLQPQTPDSSQVWRRNESASELVLTVLGVSRFRIVEDSNFDSNCHNNHNNHSGRSFHHPVPIFWVEQWDHPAQKLPSPLVSQFGVGGNLQRRRQAVTFASAGAVPTKCNNATFNSQQNSHETENLLHDPQQLQRRLQQQQRSFQYHSFSSVTPTLAYRSILPYQLFYMIVSLLQVIPSLRGLLQTQQPDDQFGRHQSLMSFGYEVASNLALEVNEKLELLEFCRSPVEFLSCLYEHVQQHHQNYQTNVTSDNDNQTNENDKNYGLKIYCKNCSYPLADVATSLFTLPGATGTTGNYVNEYGHVHQTITIRRLLCFTPSSRSTASPYIRRFDVNNYNYSHFQYQTDVQEQFAEYEIVKYHGRPETRDSWFPGYSWLIMSCAFCSHHLGWKFQKVPDSPQPSQNNIPTESSPTEATSSSQSEQCRPDFFFGLSAANISTFVRKRRRQDNRNH